MPDSLKGLLEERFGQPLGVPAEVDTHPELLSLARHRSCRRFRPDPLPEGWLPTLLACGLCVPSKSDLQQVSVVQVEDRALRSEIAALVPSMPWVGTAPAFLVVCGDGRRIRAICAERGKPFANDHLDALFNPTVDASLVLMGVLRAAEAVGLGGCPVSMLRNHAREVSRLLALPAWVFPVAGLALGWPEEEGGTVRARLPLEVTVHVDRYRDTGLPAALDAYDRRRAAREPVSPPQQRLVERFGRAEPYGWSEDKARQMAEPQREDFGAYLREQGYRFD